MAIIQLPQAARRRVLKSTTEQQTTDASVRARLARAVDAVAEFVPAELIGIYITASAILAPMSVITAISIVIGCAILIPVLFWLGAKVPALDPTWAAPNRGAIALLMLVSIVSFLAWVWALPGGPVTLVWGPSAAKGGALTVVVLSIALPLIARKFGWVGPKPHERVHH